MTRDVDFKSIFNKKAVDCDRRGQKVFTTDRFGFSADKRKMFCRFLVVERRVLAYGLQLYCC